MTKTLRNAFTLVELMVVVTIIAILATIAVPSFLKYRDASLTAKCMTNLRRIQDAREAYFLAYPAKTVITSGDTAFLEFVGEKVGEGSYSTADLKCPKGGGAYVLELDSIGHIDTMPVCPNYTDEHVYSGY